MQDPAGLVDISTEQLEHLLRGVYRGDVECPLTPTGLALIRLQPVALELLAHLRGLEQRAVRAVLVAVIAERRAVARRDAANDLPGS